MMHMTHPTQHVGLSNLISWHYIFGSSTMLTSSVMQPNNIVHIDTSNSTRWPQQPILMALRLWLATVLMSSVMQPHNMVHIDTSDPTRRLSNPFSWNCVFGSVTVLMSSDMQSHNMVHIDTFDPTHWPEQPNIMALRLWLHNNADLVYHAT